jgi:Na+/proline symporter
LVCGLYWRRASTQGAIVSLAAGIGTWVLFLPKVSRLGTVFPGQLAGLLAGLAGMVVGSLAPQWLRNRHDPVGEVAAAPSSTH